MKLYRFRDWVETPYLEVFDVLSETKCGYWFMDTCKWPVRKRWISKTSHYAHTTTEIALESYIIRKTIHIKHLKNNLKHIEALLKVACSMDVSTKLLEYKTNDLSFNEVFNKGGF